MPAPAKMPITCKSISDFGRRLRDLLSRGRRCGQMVGGRRRTRQFVEPGFQRRNPLMRRRQLREQRKDQCGLLEVGQYGKVRWPRHPVGRIQAPVIASGISLRSRHASQPLYQPDLQRRTANPGEQLRFWPPKSGSSHRPDSIVG